MSWQPKAGERVIAVLPDGHEIEGAFSPKCGFERVVLNGGDVLYTDMSRLKPVPIEEPQTFGACVTDASGGSWVRCATIAGAGEWRNVHGGMRHWARLLDEYGPLTVVNADPWGES